MEKLKTKHKDDCRRVFKRYDLACPRCQELSNGAEARQGWFKPRQYTGDNFKSCEHGASNLNPGGYCNVCGNGRDFS